VATLNQAPRPSGTPQPDRFLASLKLPLTRLQPVWESLTTGGAKLADTLVDPLLDDYNRVAQNARLWEQVGAALGEVRANVLAGLRTLDPLWRGDAATYAETHLRDRWGAALTADAATARQIGATLPAVVQAFQRIREPFVSNVEQLMRALDDVVRLRLARGVDERERAARIQELANVAVTKHNTAMQLIADLGTAIEQASKQIRDLYAAGLALARVPDIRFGAPAHTSGPAAQPGLGDRGGLGSGGAYRVVGPDGRELIQLTPRREGIPQVAIPNNTDADGFRVGPAWNVVDSSHTYHIATRTHILFEQGRDLIGQEIVNHPVPNTAASPASPDGTRNDAYAGQYVRSYTIASPDPTRYTDIMVNYTIAGDHTLHEGYVMRYGERQPDGTISIVSYGEGNAFAQQSASPMHFFNGILWRENQWDIEERVARQVGVPMWPLGEPQFPTAP
jgi:hypothetical protein